MAGIIKTVTVGDKDIKFEANGATFVLYQQAFGKDGLLEIQSVEKEPTKSLPLAQEFAYVMSGAYEKGIGFVKWLSQFGVMDVPNSAEEIFGVLMQSLNGNDEPVKNATAVEDEQ